MIDYKNPTPVAVVLVPLYSHYDNKIKLLLIRRNIEPKKGMLAFPGGFVNEGESIETAALRELEEETGIKYDLPNSIKLWESRITPNNQVLVFCIANDLPENIIPTLTLNDEVSEFVVSSLNVDEDNYAFPLHKEMAKKYLSLREWGQI